MWLFEMLKQKNLSSTKIHVTEVYITDEVPENVTRYPDIETPQQKPLPDDFACARHQYR